MRLLIFIGRILLLLVALSMMFVLASCSVGPTDLEYTSSRGSTLKLTTAGASLLTRNDYEQATVSKGEFKASHRVHGKDEVAVPRYSAWQAVGTAGADALGDVTDTIVEGATQ